MRGVWGALALGAAVGACSTVPDVEYSYYPSKASVDVTVTVTVTCSADSQTMSVATAAQATPTYTADVSQKPYTVSLKGVEGAFGSFADSSFAFQFYDDGRLKSVNATTTGQGETIIKSAVSLVAPLIGGAAAGAEGPKPTSECAVVRNFGSADKGLTLLYRATLASANDFKSPKLVPEPQSAAAQQALQPALGPVALQARVVAQDEARVRPADGSLGNTIPLRLQKMATVELRVTVKGAAVWAQSLTVPESGPDSSYIVPIPKAALFGQQSFALTLSEGGAVQSITYGKQTGVSGALNAANAVVQAPTTSNTQHAAEIKAQADVIAQTTRLSKCRANPNSCS